MEWARMIVVSEWERGDLFVIVSQSANNSTHNLPKKVRLTQKQPSSSSRNLLPPS